MSVRLVYSFHCARVPKVGALTCLPTFCFRAVDRSLTYPYKSLHFGQLEQQPLGNTIHWNGMNAAAGQQYAQYRDQICWFSTWVTYPLHRLWKRSRCISSGNIGGGDCGPRPSLYVHRCTSREMVLSPTKSDQILAYDNLGHH